MRRYETVAELFVNISGIMNFLIFLGFIVSRFENDYRISSYFSKDLFIYHNSSKMTLNEPAEENQKIKKNVKKFQAIERINEKKQRKNKEITNQVNISKDQLITKINKILLIMINFFSIPKNIII